MTNSDESARSRQKEQQGGKQAGGLVEAHGAGTKDAPARQVLPATITPARREPPGNDAGAAQVDADNPQVSLLGQINDESITKLRDQLREAEQGDGPITVEMSTLGGDAEAGRRMALEIDLARARLEPRRLLFLGKTNVYSAGVTVMAAFPREDRYLTRDAMLLIHCRQLERTLEISGPMRSSRAKVEALLHQIDSGVSLEMDGFERLIAGSAVPIEELLEKALYNWYVSAEEATDRGLVAGVI